MFSKLSICVFSVWEILRKKNQSKKGKQRKISLKRQSVIVRRRRCCILWSKSGKVKGVKNYIRKVFVARFVFIRTGYLWKISSRRKKEISFKIQFLLHAHGRLIKQEIFERNGRKKILFSLCFVIPHYTTNNTATHDIHSARTHTHTYSRAYIHWNCWKSLKCQHHQYLHTSSLSSTSLPSPTTLFKSTKQTARGQPSYQKTWSLAPVF